MVQQVFERFHEKHIDDKLDQLLLQKLANKLISALWKEDKVTMIDGKAKVLTTFTNTNVVITIPNTNYRLEADLINYCLTETVADENQLLKDYNGIKIGDEFHPRHMKITKSMKPYEAIKDGGSLWYFIMFDGSGSNIARLWKTMTVKEFYEKWERVVKEK